MTDRTLLTTTARVMTWNVWWRFGPWQARLPAIEHTIARVNPDVVALQEVWGDGEADLAAHLGSALGYEHVFRFRHRTDDVAFGNGLLSRWPIRSVESRDLPGVEGRDEKRLVVAAQCVGPRGPISVFSTHLNYRADDSAIRQRQVEVLAEFVAERTGPESVALVCGDFNAQPGSDEIRMLTGETAPAHEGLVFRDAWRAQHGHAEGFTWSNRNPFAAAELESETRIDYIFAGAPRCDGAGHVIACEVCGDDPVAGVWPSDHFALMADVRY